MNWSGKKKTSEYVFCGITTSILTVFSLASNADIYKIYRAYSHDFQSTGKNNFHGIVLLF